MFRAGAVALAAVVLLAGCTGDPLAERYGNGGSDNRTSNDGAITEIAPENRGDAPTFEGTTDAGGTVSSDDYAGEILVVNFWYAACGPCRAEAPDLEALFQEHKDSGVSFLGVNTLDQSATALAFARNYGISYPSVMDGDTGEVRLAFAGQASPSAVPTTLVLDKKGRVAVRFLGQITAPSNLDTVIRELLAEEL
ncbi:thiol-disulfide isomerase/thioredoxin [Homoserinimonas aerilata]|uniref:Thiol-disulfide isomerase/thioredoxin n=1 Tax=Homoserinimonas aerilata TaxID=1162970 RepID=A0A542YA53_9MICO|nr:TlpA disulfide reductase family protein [Homoserinimonas aerilata]TQL44980.1 thiol-disulfide isomerase/thioredoxin [Homoserinimonas aerilata]